MVEMSSSGSVNTVDHEGIDKESLGRAGWTILHSISASYPVTPSVDEQKDVNQFVHLFAKLYPCEPCAYGFQEIIKENPPDVTSHSAFALWLCNAHNQVNVSLNKPIFDCNLESIQSKWGKCEACSSHTDELEAFKALTKLPKNKFN